MKGASSQGQVSKSSSPQLGRSRIPYDDPVSDGEAYSPDREHGDAGSEGSWDDRQDKQDAVLPEAAIKLDAATPGLDSAISDDTQDGFLARDVQRKTAYYDYAAEKQMSQADAKLFYQRSQLDAQKTGGSNWGSQNSPHGSPITRGNMYASMEQEIMPTSGSMYSAHSAQSSPQYQAKFRSAYPTGVANLDKSPESNIVQEPRFGQFTSHSHEATSLQRRDSLLKADEAARDHSAHPGLPHENKPLLETEGLHGAGAGIGLGSGVGGFADNDANITSELSTIYSNIQKVLDFRHKYIRLSLQGQSDNPKDEPSWNIYPAHPEPVWDEERGRTGRMSHAGSMANSTILSSDRRPQTPKAAKPKRKPGQDIGSDFDMADLLPLPEAGEMEFRLDENSVYQVYENSKAGEHESPVINIPTIREFYMDLEEVLNISSDGPSKKPILRIIRNGTVEAWCSCI